MMSRGIPAHLFLPSQSFEPAYLTLHRSGELQQRASTALDRLSECRQCPRDCGADRTDGKTGTCKTGRVAMVSSAFPHLGEEDCLRGWEGSGTIFFAACGLRCVMCQNFEISQMPAGVATPPERIAQMMLNLQAAGCHNINLVTPSHVIAQILEALVLAVEGGLHLPIVYNTSGYDTLESLHLLDGVIDIYMPDFKFWEPATAHRYLLAKDYPEVARQAIAEMHRQVGPLKFDEQGLAKRGVLARHLVMPGKIAGTESIMRFLAGLSTDTYVNIMDQYYPAGQVLAGKYVEINRRTTTAEYFDAIRTAREAGLWRFDERVARGPLLRWQPLEGPRSSL